MFGPLVKKLSIASDTKSESLMQQYHQLIYVRKYHAHNASYLGAVSHDMG